MDFPPDEIDRMVAELRPPARFAGHVPDFSVEEREITFRHAHGPVLERLWILKDGPRYLGLARKSSPIEEGICLFGFHPGALAAELRLPPGRYHYDTALGPFLQTGMGGIPLDAPWEWSGGGRELVLRRAHGGQENIFTLRLDPVLGYLVEADLRLPEGLERFKVAKANCPGTFEAWPQRLRYRRTAYTPGGRPGIEGYCNNPYAVDRAKRHARTLPGSFTTRDGGFIAYLDDAEGWGCAFTRSGGGDSEVMPACDAHNVWHPTVPAPPGRRVRQRLAGLPPEVTRRILEAMVVYFRGEKAVILPVGERVDFRAQPVALDTPARGLFDTQGPMVVEEADGAPALRIEGRLWPDIPQVALETRARYRVEAELRIAGGPEARASVLGQTFEWSAKQNPPRWFAEFEAGPVAPGDGWKRVAFEVATGDWDPFLNLVFRAEGGVAHMRGFAVIRIA